MSQTRRLSRLSLCLLLAMGAAAMRLPAHAAEAAAPAPKGNAPEAKVAPLLLLVLGELGRSTLEEAKSQGFFSSIYRRVVGDRLSTGASASAPVEAAASGAATPVAALPVPAPAATVVPAVAYSLEQLDPASFEILRRHELAGGSLPVLRTGDVFAIRYATNLPGLVRLEAEDDKGEHTDLGTYTVLPDQNNRLPASRGIGLTGNPGTELVRILFYPCIPRELAGKPEEARLRARIPFCDAEAGSSVASAASGKLAPRALVNLAQPDPVVAYAGTSDYQPRDVTSATLVIRHIKP